MEEVNDEVALSLRMDRCNGTACLRCERACPRGGFRFIDLCFKGIEENKMLSGIIRAGIGNKREGA